VTQSRRSIGYLLLAILVVTVTLLFAFQRQRAAAVSAAGRTESAVSALTAMLDQETGMRGFLYTGQEEFLQPYLNGRSAYEQARLQVMAAATGDHTSEQLATAEDEAARGWQTYAERTIAARRITATAPQTAPAVSQALAGKKQMDLFRSLNGQLRTRLNQRRDASLRSSGLVSVAVVVFLAAFFALLGMLALQRSTRRAVAGGETEIAYRVRQREFSDLIQAVESETEAHQLVQRHLQRSIKGARATVLIRNNSDNRLQAATELPPESVLAEPLAEAEPRSCLAIRLGRPHQDGTDHDELISCRLCCGVPGTASCEPLLVGGKVIGSVLTADHLRSEASAGSR
jgi:CHASE3 domain sensor protein